MFLAITSPNTRSQFPRDTQGGHNALFRTCKTLTRIWRVYGAHNGQLRRPLQRTSAEERRAVRGRVTYIVDADGLCVGHENGGIEIRVSDFYACEKGEPGGEQAKQILQDIAFGKHAKCIAGKKSWDRVVAYCEINGKSVGKMLKERGMYEGGRGWQGNN